MKRNLGFIALGVSPVVIALAAGWLLAQLAGGSWLEGLALGGKILALGVVALLSAVVFWMIGYVMWYGTVTPEYDKHHGVETLVTAVREKRATRVKALAAALKQDGQLSEASGAEGQVSMIEKGRV